MQLSRFHVKQLRNGSWGVPVLPLGEQLLLCSQPGSQRCYQQQGHLDKGLHVFASWWVRFQHPSAAGRAFPAPGLAQGEGGTQPGCLAQEGGCPGVTVPQLQLPSGTAACLGRKWRIKQQRLKDGPKPLEVERGKTCTVGVSAGGERTGTPQRGQCQLPAYPRQFLLLFFNVQGSLQSHNFIPALPQV